MNDSDTLTLYTAILLFLNNPENAGAILRFPTTLTPHHRQIVYSIAAKFDVVQASYRVEIDQFVTVSRRTTDCPASDLIASETPFSRGNHLQEHPRAQARRLPQGAAAAGAKGLRRPKPRHPRNPNSPGRHPISLGAAVGVDDRAKRLCPAYPQALHK